jgi:thioredoxin 1
MASPNIVQVTDATFASEVEQFNGLSLVDFWAAWCGPCKAIAPVVDELAEQYAGKIKVAKLDTDLNQQTAVRFNVRSIPTILFFKNGKPVDSVVGFDQKIKAILEAKIRQHLA